MVESYSVRAILSAVDSSFSSTLARAGQATQNFGSAVGQKMNDVGKAMTIAGAATTAMGVKALKGFGDFQSSLNQAAVIAGGTSKNIGELADVANRMGAELPISARDAAAQWLKWPGTVLQSAKSKSNSRRLHKRPRPPGPTYRPRPGSYSNQ